MRSLINAFSALSCCPVRGFSKSGAAALGHLAGWRLIMCWVTIKTKDSLF